MRKILISFFIMLIAVSGHAEDYFLEWDASTGAEGYKVYFTDGATQYQKDVGNVVQYNLDDLNAQPGTEYTYYVTAYNTCGESEPSESVSHMIPVFEVGEDNLPIKLTVPVRPQTIIINVE